MGNPNNTIRLQFELDRRKADRTAKAFLDDLERQFKQLQTKLNAALESGVDGKSTKAVNDLTRAIDKAEKEIAQLKKTSDTASRSVRKLGRESSQVSKQSTQLSGGFKDVAGSLLNVSNLAKGAGLLGLAVGFTELTQAVIQFGDASLQAFGQFETGIAEVRTLLPNLSDEGFGQLQDDVRDFALDIGRTTDDILPALYQALSAGIPQDTVFDFLGVANQAAIAGVTDLQTSVDALSSVVNAYGADVITAGQASDVFFTTIRLGKTTFEELAPVISQVTPLSADLGIAFEDVGAAIANITATGTPTAQAVTQIRSALVALSEPASEISKQFEELTGQSVREFIAAGNDLSDVFAIVSEIAGTTGLEFTELFGRIEAALAATVLASNGAEDYAETLGELQGATGATSDAAAVFSDTIAEAERRTNAQTEALKLQIGEGLAPARLAFLELKGAIAEFAAGTIEGINANSELVRTFDELDIALSRGRGGVGAIGAISDELQEAGISVSAFREVLEELQPTFEGTNSQLVQTALEIAKTARATEIAGQRVQRISTVYADSLRDVTDTTEEVTQATDDLTGAYELTADDLETVAKNTADYEAEQRKLIIALVNSQEVADEQSKAIFDAGVAAELSSDKLNELAVELGLVTQGQVDANQRARELFKAFETRTITVAELTAELQGLEGALSGVAQSAINTEEAINSALAGASSRLTEITRRPTGGGGGRTRDVEGELSEELTEIADELSEELVDIQEEADEEITAIQKANDEEVADLERGLIDGTSEIAERRENELKELRLENEQEVAEANRQFDEERANRLAEFERQRAETFLGALDEAQAEEPVERTQEEQIRDVVEGAAERGATAEQIADILVSGGVATEEQVQQALAEELRARGEDAIEQAIADGIVTEEQALAAIQSLNEQLAAGAENIDLSAFGIAIRDAAAIELEVEEERQAALSEIRTRFLEQEEAIRLRAQEATAQRIAELNKRSAEEVAQIQERTAERIATANERAAKRVETANTRAAKAIEQAQNRGGSAARNTTQALIIQRSQMLLNLGEQTKDLVQKRELAQLAFQQLADAGIIAQTEADRQIRLFELNAITAALAQSQEDVTTAIDDGESSLTNNQQTLDLLATDLFDSAENAQALAQILRSDQIPAFTELINQGVPLRDVLDQIGVNLEELPEEVQVAIDTNADEALTEINDVDTALSELDGKEATVRVNVEEDERVAGGGGGVGSSGAGEQAPGDAFQLGGFTGRGATNQEAGTVHREELVVPKTARDGGIAGIVQFALARDPDIAINTRRASPAIPSSAPFNPSIAPNVTNIDNSRGGDTISNNTDNSTRALTINAGIDDRIVRSVVNFEELENANGLMRRG